MTILLVIVCLVLCYAFVLRKYVKGYFPSFFAWIEPIEANLWAKSRTILLARLTWLGGLVAGVANMTAGVDWTAVLSQLVSHLPAGVQPYATSLIVPLCISILGGLFEWLRRVTAPLAPAKEE